MLANIFEHVQKCWPTFSCVHRKPYQHVGGNVGQHVGAVCGELENWMNGMFQKYKQIEKENLTLFGTKKILILLESTRMNMRLS